MEALGELFTEFDVLGAFWMTIKLAVVSAVLSLLLGTVIAVMRVSPAPAMRAVGAAYVTIFRNTPLTLIVLFCYLGLFVNMRLSPMGAEASFADHGFAWGVIGLSIYHASFVCEALRSGINTVPQGQAEAARAIGLGFLPALRHVVMPQAFRGAIAPLGNTLIALTKNTTVCAVIGVAEASNVMKSMIEFRPDVLVLVFLIMAAGFVVLTLPTGFLFTHLSRRYGVQR